MTFRIREDRGFGDGGKVYTAPVVAKKFNGYKVKAPWGETVFLGYEDIVILELSDTEKNMSVEL